MIRRQPSSVALLVRTLDHPGPTICKGTKAWCNTIPAALPVEEEDHEWSWGRQHTSREKNITLWIDDLLWPAKNGNHRWKNAKGSDGLVRNTEIDARQHRQVCNQAIGWSWTYCTYLYIAVHGLFLFMFRQASAIATTGRTSCPKPPPGSPGIPGSPGQGNINCKDRSHHSHGFPCGNSFLCHALGR